MSSYWMLVLLSALLAFSRPACGYKLVVFPVSEKTHMLVLLRLATELAVRNHTVYFMTAECHQPFAEEVAARFLAARAEQLHYIKYSMNCTYHKQQWAKSQMMTPQLGVLNILRNYRERLHDVLGNEELMQQLRSLNPDLMINDVMSYGMAVALKLGIRNVDFDVGTAGSLFEPAVYGAEPASAYVPAVGSGFPTTGMAFWQRAVNAAISKVVEAGLRFTMYNPLGLFMATANRFSVGWRFPYDNFMLLLVNSHFVLEPPRAIAPNTKYVGPLLPTPAQPLPQQLQEWVEGSGPLGCVFISFGGSLQAPIAASRTIIQTIRSMPDVQFVWSLSQDQQAALASDLASLTNIQVGTWLPQNDLLGHPKIKAFVTQGGYLSMAEAAYHGVPILGLPFIPGQAEIIQYAQDKGRGLLLPSNTLVKGNTAAFREGLMQLLTGESFAAAARVASKRLKSTARPYPEQAAEWVEYAAALKDDGPFLHPQRLYQMWWQQMNADVALLYLLLLAAALYGVARCLGLVFGGRLHASRKEQHLVSFPGGKQQQAGVITPLMSKSGSSFVAAEIVLRPSGGKKEL